MVRTRSTSLVVRASSNSEDDHDVINIKFKTRSLTQQEPAKRRRLTISEFKVTVNRTSTRCDEEIDDDSSPQKSKRVRRNPERYEAFDFRKSAELSSKPSQSQQKTEAKSNKLESQQKIPKKSQQKANKTTRSAAKVMESTSADDNHSFDLESFKIALNEMHRLSSLREKREPRLEPIVTDAYTLSFFSDNIECYPSGTGLFFLKFNDDFGLVHMKPTMQSLSRDSIFCLNFFVVIGHLKVVIRANEKVETIELEPFSYLKLSPNVKYDLINDTTSTVCFFYQINKNDRK